VGFWGWSGGQVLVVLYPSISVYRDWPVNTEILIFTIGILTTQTLEVLSGGGVRFFGGGGGG